MKFLFDLNIWIDIAARPKSCPESLLLYQKLSSNQAQICLPLSGYTTIFYLIDKLLSQEAALVFFNGLKDDRVQFLSFTKQEQEAAQRMKFPDHEDACIVATALANKIDMIITRNTKDFIKSPIAVASPAQFLNS
jgi:predicted nucleic acid-binding protein